MLDFGKKGKVVVTCKDRFAPYLELELKELGFMPQEMTRTSITLHASLWDCVFLNLRLRIASHVLFEIKTFYLQHVDDLYRRIKSIPWEDYITADSYFSVSSTVDHETVDNTLFTNVRVKDAIVDRFREKAGRRPDSGSEYSGAVFQLYWKEKHASIYLNTSGETLAKHGYRKIPGQAPMLEALATACLYASGWDRQSPLVNPMCGSGTLAIEAALIATKRFPGLLRDNYAFMHLNGFDRARYDMELTILERQIVSPENLHIVANDISEQAVLFSQENAETAGVADFIDFQTGDFFDLELPETNTGILIFNPEYGERLGDEEELKSEYKRIGDFMKQKAAGYTGYVFTGNFQLGKSIGLRASRKIEFYNGTIDCRLLKFELYKGKRG